MNARKANWSDGDSIRAQAARVRALREELREAEAVATNNYSLLKTERTKNQRLRDALEISIATIERLETVRNGFSSCAGTLDVARNALKVSA